MLHAARPLWPWLIFDVRQRKMKWVIAVLWIASASGLIGAITNVQHLSMGRETTVIYYTSSGRLFALIVGVSCAIAAFACTKKKKSGWWMVSGMIVALIVTTAWGIVRVVASDLFLAILWLAQIVLMAVLLRWWFRQANRFTSNEKKA